MEIQTWHWHFQRSGGGGSVDSDLVNSYLHGAIDRTPTDDSTPSLKPGETYTGVLAFPTAGRGGVITLEDPGAQRVVVKWNDDGPRATSVKAEFGQSVRGRVGRPAFVVSARSPRWVRGGDASLSSRPSTGSYLVVDFRFAGDDATSNQPVLPRNFAFVPAGSIKAVGGSGSGVIEGGLPFTSLTGTDPLVGPVAFDVKRGPGTLELLDGAGRAVISWAVR